MQIPLLRDVVVIFGLAVAVIYVCHQLRIPTIVGFLLTGVLAGPHGLALVRAVHEVDLLAEIGVVLLLFTIGIELSFANLLAIRTSLLVGGSFQVVLTFSAGALVAAVAGQSLTRAVFIGFVAALSSTAIVLKILQERAEVESPQGRATLGILIFQDIAAVPMMMVVGLMAGTSQALGGPLLPFLAKATAVILLVILGAKWVVPQLLHQAARLRDREVFLISVVLIILGVAWLTSMARLSLALGAFLAGLIISRSEYSHRVLGDILPLRDVFLSLFFVSVGMLLDVGLVMKHPGLIALLSVGVVVGKVVLAGFPTLLLGYPLRTAVLSGFALGQIGEFSFVLLRQGLDYQMLTNDLYQMLLGVSVVTMLVTPVLIAVGPRVAEWLLRCPVPQRLKTGSRSELGAKPPSERSDHLIIVGFGLNGQNLARAASAADIPYVIIELNPETVQRESQLGQPIFYGDATNRAVLDHAGVARARVLVVAISDPAATRRIVEIARRVGSALTIIARTRFVSEVKPLRDLGADEVIPEEFETSVEIFTRVLARYLVPHHRILTLAEELRAQGYLMFRDLSHPVASLADLRSHIPDHEIATFQLDEGSPLCGKSLAEIDLRRQFGVTLLAIRRASDVVANPTGDVQIHKGDILVVLGTREKMATLDAFLNPPQN